MIVGITGHQKLGNEQTICWIQEAIKEHLQTLDPDIGLTSLAKGADQLFALTCHKLQIPFKALIPCKQYELTFGNNEDLAEFQYLLSKANSIEILGYDFPSEEAFLAAGKKVVDLSDHIIAIWNGMPAKGKGGTADIVTYAKRGKKSVTHINPENKQVITS